MSTSKKRFVGVMVVCAGALALVLVLRSRADRGERAVAARDAGEGRAAEGLDTLASPVTDPSPAGAMSGVRDLAQGERMAVMEGGATLVVCAVSSTDARPIGGVRLTLLDRGSIGAAPAREVESAVGSLVVSPRTGADGRATFTVPNGAELTLLAEEHAPNAGGKVLDVTALAPDETREVVLKLAPGDDARMYGRVVRCEDGAAVEGAAVRLCRAAGSPAQDTLDEEVLRESVTDAEGRFEFDYPSARFPYVRVERAGCGTVRLFIDEQFQDPSTAALVCLDATGTLRAEVADAAGGPIAGATVSLHAVEKHVATPGMLVTVPRETVGPPTRQCETDGSGSCTLTDLPSGLELRVALTAHGEKRRFDERSVVLLPGEERTLRWLVVPGGRIEGRAVGDAGQPVASRSILVQRAGAEEARVLDHSRRTVARTRTNAEGRFKFEDVPPGRWWVGAAPPDSVFTNSAVDQPVGLPVIVDVTSEATSPEVVLELSSGIAIRGRVLGPHDETIEAVFVTASEVRGRRTVHVKAEGDGSFRVGELIAGNYRLSAGGGMRWPQASFRTNPRDGAEAVVVPAGASDIVLRLFNTGSISGEVRDAATNVLREATVYVHEHDASDDTLLQLHAPTGTFRSSQLTPGLYDVSASTVDLRMGCLRGVRIDPSNGERHITIATEPGALLRVHCEASLDSGMCTVIADGGVVAKGKLTSYGELSRVVPAGELTVRFTPTGCDVPLEQRVEVSVGHQAIVVFRSDP